jgi:hypothetical protein
MSATMSEPATQTKPTPVPMNVAPRPLNEQRFGLAQFATNRWSVTPPFGTSFARVLEPTFWGNVGHKLRPGDIIEVHAEDGSYFAELYVRAAHRLAANVAVLRHVDLVGEAGSTAVDDSPFTVQFRGPHAKWCVMRGKEIVQDKFPTQADALKAVGERAAEWAA